MIDSPLKKRPRCRRNVQDLRMLWWMDTFDELLVILLIFVSFGFLLHVPLKHRTHGALSSVFDKILDYANHPLNNWPYREDYPYNDLADVRYRLGLRSEQYTRYEPSSSDDDYLDDDD